MTPEEVDALLAEVEHYPGLYGGVGQKLAEAVVALREQVAELEKYAPPKSDRGGPRDPVALWFDKAKALEADNAALRQLVAEQAEDDGLWFMAQTASEAYLQQALRTLHAVIEGDAAMLAGKSANG